MVVFQQSPLVVDFSHRFCTLDMRRKQVVALETMPPLWCRSRTPGIQADRVSRWKDATRETSFCHSPLCRTHMAWGWGGIPLKPKPSGLGAVTTRSGTSKREKPGLTRLRRSKIKIEKATPPSYPLASETRIAYRPGRA